MDNGSEGTSDCDSIKISSTGNSEAGDLSGKQSGICASSETGDYHHADIDSHGCTDAHCKNACVVFTLTHCDTHKNTHSLMRVIYCCVMVTRCLRVTLHLPKWLKNCKRF